MLSAALVPLPFFYKEATVVAMTRFAGVGFNIALGILIWHEVPDSLSALGGTLIL